LGALSHNFLAVGRSPQRHHMESMPQAWPLLVTVHSQSYSRHRHIVQ